MMPTDNMSIEEVTRAVLDDVLSRLEKKRPPDAAVIDSNSFDASEGAAVTDISDCKQSREVTDIVSSVVTNMLDQMENNVSSSQALSPSANSKRNADAVDDSEVTVCKVEINLQQVLSEFVKIEPVDEVEEPQAAEVVDVPGADSGNVDIVESDKAQEEPALNAASPARAARQLVDEIEQAITTVVRTMVDKVVEGQASPKKPKALPAPRREAPKPVKKVRKNKKKEVLPSRVEPVPRPDYRYFGIDNILTVPQVATPSEALNLCTRKPEAPSKPITKLSSGLFNSVFHLPSTMQPSPSALALNGSKRKTCTKRRAIMESFDFDKYSQMVERRFREHHVCDLCFLQTKDAAQLKEHVISTHINLRRLAVEDRILYGIRLREDTPQNETQLFRCNVCPDLFFPDKFQTKKHITTGHSYQQGQPINNLNYKCSQCSSTFASKSNLQKHEALHKESLKQYSCPYCFLTSNSLSDLKNHIKRHEESQQKLPCMYLCEIKTAFESLAELRAHLMSAHQSEYHGCSKCLRRFVTKRELQQHVTKQHPLPAVHEKPIITITPVEAEQQPEQPAPANKPIETCETCGAVFSNYLAALKHKKKAHGMAFTLHKPKKVETGTTRKVDAPEEFSLPNLTIGKRTVALTPEVTISAIPPEAEEKPEGPSLVIIKIPDLQEAPQKPVQRRKPSNKKKLELKIKLKPSSKPVKSKKKAAPKPKTVITVIKKEVAKPAEPAKDACTPLESPMEVEKPVEPVKAADQPVEPVQEVKVTKEIEKAPEETEKPAEALVVTEQAAEAAKAANRVEEAPMEVTKEPKAGKKAAKPAKKPRKAQKAAKKATERPQRSRPITAETSPDRTSRPMQLLSQRPLTPKTPEDMSLFSLDVQAEIRKRRSSVKRKLLGVSNAAPRKTSSRPTRNNPNTSEELAHFLHSLEMGQSTTERSSRKNKKQLESELRAGEILEEGFTGEWCKLRTYICHVCMKQFPDLNDMDEHANAQHPHVLTFYSDVVSNVQLPTDFLYRPMNRVGVCGTARVLPATVPAECPCTKCGRMFFTVAELHKHILECGGDTTWMLASTRRRKQWRPFGTRRRARHGMKRTPMSPAKSVKKRKQDRDTLEKMASKRGAPKRIINFTEDEIKTRSQATIHSLRPAAAGIKPSKVRSVPKQTQQTPASGVAVRRSSSEAADKQTKAGMKAQTLEKTPDPPLAAVNLKPKKKKAAKPAVPIEEKPVEEVKTEHGPEPERNNAKTKCPHCKKGLLNQSSLNRHLKICTREPTNVAKQEASTNQAVDKCPICYVAFSSRKLLERHASNCNESPSEITNRAKVFRKRASELSKQSDASSEAIDAPEVEQDASKPKRRKRGKGKPFFIRKNATKKNLVAVKKAKEGDLAPKAKTKLKRELASLALLAPEATPPSRPKKAIARKAAEVEETLPVEPKEAEVAPEIRTSESMQPEQEKLKKKASKKLIKSAAIVKSSPSSPLPPVADVDVKVEPVEDKAKSKKDAKKRKAKENEGEVPAKKLKKEAVKKKSPAVIGDDLEDNIPLCQVIKKNKSAKAAATPLPEVNDLSLPKVEPGVVVEPTENGKCPKKKKSRRSDAPNSFCELCNSAFSTAFNYQKHLKTQRHLNNIKDDNTLDAQIGAASDSRGANDEGFSTAVNYQKTVKHLNDAAEGTEEPTLPEDSVAENEGLEEIVFPAIKEDKEFELPPAPPNSPCPPDDDSHPPVPVELINSLEERTREVDEPEEKESVGQPTPPVPDVADSSDEEEEEEEEWPAKLPPPPKIDFDAVRDSVPNWTNKRSSFQPPSPPPVEPPPVLMPVGPTQPVAPYVEPPAPSNLYLMGNFEGQQSIKAIQDAMGATDEEMDILENLGCRLDYQFVYDNSSTFDATTAAPTIQPTPVNLADASGPIEPLENAELMDLDNQVTTPPQPPEPIREDAFIAPTKSDVSLDETVKHLNESATDSSALLSTYREKEMVCPVCNKHFLGMDALSTHIVWAHKNKDNKLAETDANNGAKSSETVGRERDSLQGAANVLHNAGGPRSGVLRTAAGALVDECAQMRRRIACFVCKEMYTDMVALNTHIRERHIRNKCEASTSSDDLKRNITTRFNCVIDIRALVKGPQPAVEKRNSEGLDPRVPLINLDTPLTLTAIAKQAIKPISDKFPESEESLQAVISKMRKATTTPKEQPRMVDEERPPLFPENVDCDPLLPESDMQCPICVGVVKNFHSLCRHLKTQHTEWTVSNFSSSMFNYLTLKRQNPSKTLNKKYLINVPGKRLDQPEASTSSAIDEAQAQTGGSNTQPNEASNRDEDIRNRAFAALKELSVKKSVRGSKRRPLDLSELGPLDGSNPPSPSSGSSAT